MMKKMTKNLLNNTFEINAKCSLVLFRNNNLVIMKYWDVPLRSYLPTRRNKQLTRGTLVVKHEFHRQPSLKQRRETNSQFKTKQKIEILPRGIN